MAIERVRVEVDFTTVLTAARTGQPWALERIYTSLAPNVAGFLRAQGASDAEDLTSDVFIGVLRNLSTFDGDEGRFRSWVFTIAHRRLVDERRRRARQPDTVPLRSELDIAAPDDVPGDVDRVLASERVRALCQRLVPAQRDVLLLRLFGRLTVAEVARVIGRSPAAVKGLQRRALATLAARLERGGVQS